MNLRTSAVRHPENDLLIIRRNWQVEALLSLGKSEGFDENGKKKRRVGNEETGAEILSVLEYHHNNRLANKLLKQLIQKAVQKHNKYIKELGDWLPYSLTYWHECMMGRGKEQIVTALEYLEELRFINTKVPEDIPKFYGSTSNWYRLEVNTINEWIEAHTPRSYTMDIKTMTFVKPDTSQSIIGVNPLIVAPNEKKILKVNHQTVQTAEILQKQINGICALHKHIFNKNANTIYSKTRVKQIKDRMSESRTYHQCLQAVIGLSFSELHMGDNARNEIWDGIEYIFGTNERFERHLQNAEKKGVTGKIAYQELQAVMNGIASQYIVKRKVTPLDAFKAQEKPIQEVSNAPLDVKNRYKEFVNNIYSFFMNNAPVSLVMEQCRNNEDIAKLSVGINEEKLLVFYLIDKVSRFQENGISESVKNSINQFAVTFCKFQKLNKG